jgi:hypothetical protein
MGRPLPPSRFSIPNFPVNRLGAAHIPLKRGGADVAGIPASMFAISRVGDRAHIPRRRGGAPAR